MSVEDGEVIREFIRRYIQSQEAEDRRQDQLEILECAVDVAKEALI